MKKTLILLGMLALTPQLKAQLLLEALDAPDKQKCTPPVNNFTPSDRCLELVCDRNYGDGDHDFVYCAVQGPNGKKWLNHNLGAEYAKVSSSHYNPQAQPADYNDWKAFGSLFQEGRKADGHELVEYKIINGKDSWYVERKYPVTETKQNPISTNQSYIWTEKDVSWMTDRNNIHNLWTNEMLNNPCPNGYRVMNEADIKGILVDNYTKVRGTKTFRSTTAFFNNDYPNLTLMTAPSVWYWGLSHLNNNLKIQETMATINGNALGGTSNYWILPSDNNSHMSYKDSYTYNYGQEPYGWTFRKDEYTGNPLAHSHYYMLDAGCGNGFSNDYCYAPGPISISMAIRCVEM